MCIACDGTVPADPNVEVHLEGVTSLASTRASDSVSTVDPRDSPPVN